MKKKEESKLLIEGERERYLLFLGKKRLTSPYSATKQGERRGPTRWDWMRKMFSKTNNQPIRKGKGKQKKVRFSHSNREKKKNHVGYAKNILKKNGRGFCTVSNWSKGTLEEKKAGGGGRSHVEERKERSSNTLIKKSPPLLLGGGEKKEGKSPRKRGPSEGEGPRHPVAGGGRGEKLNPCKYSISTEKRRRSPFWNKGGGYFALQRQPAEETN